MIRIHRLASAEIEEAFLWYLKYSSRVADNFSTNLSEAFVKIQLQPLHYACFEDDYRFIRIKGFPYLVIFLSNPRTSFTCTPSPMKADSLGTGKIGDPDFNAASITRGFANFALVLEK